MANLELTSDLDARVLPLACLLELSMGENPSAEVIRAACDVVRFYLISEGVPLPLGFEPSATPGDLRQAVNQLYLYHGLSKT